MANVTGEKIGEIFAEIRTKSDKFDADMKQIEARGLRTAKSIENTFSKASVRFNDNILKKSLSEIEVSVVKLRANLERKIKLGAPLGELEALQSSIDRSEGALKRFRREAEQPLNIDHASKWGMIATGIQSSVQSIRDFMRGVKEILGDSVLLAARSEGVERAFDRLNKPDLLDQLRSATKGTVSDLELMQNAVRADRFKISLDQLGTLLQFAQRTAQATGQEVNYLVESIVMGIGRKSPMILDNLGISTVALREKFGDVGIEAATIGDITRVVSEIAKDELQKMGEDVITTADKYKRLNRDIDESKIKLGHLVNQGLKPLIDLYDQGGSKTKLFVSSIISIGSVVLQAIPLLVQLYTAKKLLASASLLSASAVSAETTAIEANTIAKVANSKVSLGLIGKVGVIATVGVAVWQLTEYINDNTAAIKKNREEADKRFPNWDKSGFGPRNQFEAGKPQAEPGRVNLGGYFSSVQQEQIVTGHKKVAVTAGEIIAKIKALDEANQDANISLAQYQKNLKEIARLNDVLTGKTEKVVKETKEIASDALALGSKEITQREIKNRLLQEELDKKEKIKQEQIDAHIAGADDPLSIGSKWMNSQYGEDALEKSKRLKQDMLDAASEFGNELENAFGRAGDKFINYMNNAIQAAIRIADIMSKVGSGDKSSESGALGIIASLISVFAAHNGGSFVGTSRGVMKMAGGGSFHVPPGYPHDTFPLMVETGEKVTVTPARDVGREGNSQGVITALARVESRLGALNRNLINKEFNANIFNPIDGTVLVKNITQPSQNNLIKAGVALENL